MGIHDQYSEARNAKDMAGFATGWWLRSPGSRPFDAALVYFTGELSISGHTASSAFGYNGGIRPAIWLNLELESDVSYVHQPPVTTDIGMLINDINKIREVSSTSFPCT